MDEQYLVRRMKNGDRSAFDSIYEKYHIPILRSAYLICGNRQDAEDVMQDTFVACWLHVRELRKDESFRYWLFRIMAQAARKTAKEHAALVPDEMIQDTADRGQLQQLVSDEYERVLDGYFVENALQALSKQQREVIVLYYYNEMSVKEIANTLQVFEGTVKSRLFTARRQMKSALQRLKKERENA
ncbi:MAG: RNA polymerase sigma factor [Lachnospiraceae bacterium]|nr:RNA polymerase sigma factor [Lachnospiraceae bacterium]MBQ9614148.1 RNA polymerase sigma factor [Lachnospiraceae bacterium]